MMNRHNTYFVYTISFGLRRYHSAFDIVDEERCKNIIFERKRNRSRGRHTRNIIVFVESEGTLRMAARKKQADGQQPFQK
jgi:hypothetical protein